MQKLVCFGDSYIANDLYPYVVDIKPLANRMADKLGVPLINFGCSASGLAYALDSFYRYLASEDFDSRDYLYFTTSMPMRLWLPESGGNHFLFPDSLGKISPSDGNYFFKKYAHEINWAMANLTPELEQSILHVIRTMAYQASQGNRCIVVNGFEISELGLKLAQAVTSNKRFRNLITKDGLIGASVSEFDEIETIKWDREHDYGRVNHFSEVNLEILANQMVAEFNNENAFNLSMLKHHFVKARQ